MTMTTERAVGFYWVRVEGGPTIVEIFRRGPPDHTTEGLSVRFMGTRGDLVLDVFRPLEWGPYLGKEPFWRDPARGPTLALVLAARSVLANIDARRSPHSSLDPAPELREALQAFPAGADG